MSNGAIAEFADGDLGRIQSILFGDQAADTQRRLVALEASTNELIARVGGELGNRLAALEVDVTQRHLVLEQRVLEAEKAAGNDSVQLGKKLDNLRADSKQSFTETKQALAAAEKQLAAETSELRSALTSFETATATSLDTKADRSHLASIFAAAAKELEGAPSARKPASKSSEK